MGATSFYKCHRCNQMHSYGYECVADPADRGLDQADKGLFMPPPAPESPLTKQVAGDHYKKLGIYQPFEVLKVWLTPEEYRGYMKGSAISYLARELDKGADIDIQKANHTLQVLIEELGKLNNDTD